MTVTAIASTIDPNGLAHPQGDDFRVVNGREHRSAEQRGRRGQGCPARDGDQPQE